MGTAQRVFEYWVDNGVLDSDKLKEVDRRILDLKMPSDAGRLPRKVSKYFRRMKADEWKNWTLVYSLYCLKGNYFNLSLDSETKDVLAISIFIMK